LAALKRTLALLAGLLIAWGIRIILLGGVELHVAGVVLRSRDPFRALVLGVTLACAYGWLYPDDVLRIGDRLAVVIANWARVIAIAVSLLLAVVAVRFGSFAAGGSDSYSYVSQAYGWVSGDFPKPLPLRLDLPPPAVDSLQIPLGYREGPRPHTMVPVTAPGMPLLMAIGILLAGACGPFFVTPVCAAVLVWATFILARRAAGPMAGVVAAVVIATTPVVLFQAITPMNDIAAGACWTAALAAALGPSRKHAVAAGICAAVGLLIRPNLLPLVAVSALAAVLTGATRERVIRVTLVVTPLVPVVLLIMWVNAAWYGSPLMSGYGKASDIYAASNVLPNVWRYGSWFLESESPWVLVGLVAVLAFRRPHAEPRTMAIAVLAIVVTVACYLPYSKFDVWWYLRFLLPAAGATATLIAVGIVALARMVPAPWGRLAASSTLVALVTVTLAFAVRAQVFGGLRDGERRYIAAGEFAADQLPENAAIFAGQHSGSVRFYSGRTTLRYDWVDPAWASGAPAMVERAGYHPYLLVDDWEIPQVRSQFGLPPDAPLPWPVFARMRQFGGLTVFDMAAGAHAEGQRTIAPAPRDWCPPPRPPI
jgi:hypothetical protein